MMMRMMIIKMMMTYFDDEYKDGKDVNDECHDDGKEKGPIPG